MLLLSLTAGSVGLNLTSAQRVYLLDPHFNPSQEDQAIDRIHRLGQEREVVAYRFILRGTVEQRMLDLQARKRELCKAALEGEGGGGGGDEDGADAGRRRARISSRLREERRLRLKDLALCLDDE